MRKIPLALPSSAEMQLADTRAIDAGTPALVLMERAGELVAKHVRRILAAEQAAAKARIVVLCGAGNNGGDGFVAARHLHEAGLQVETVLCSNGQLSEGCVAQMAAASAVRQSVLKDISATDGKRTVAAFITEEELAAKLSAATLVIDALLGTAQTAAPRGLIARAVQLLSEYTGTVVALDVPTGINPDTGEAFNPAVCATHTICLEAVKRGLLQSPARELCGEIVCESIGIALTDTEFTRLELSSLAIPDQRPRDSHKGLFGPILAIAGGAGMPGAACLVGLAALRAGAGVVHTTSAKAVEFTPELIEANLRTSDLADFRGIVVGPGLGTEDAMSRMVEHVLGQRKRMPIIADADALTIIAANKAFELLSDTIITPHPGEAARLLGCDVATVQHNRYAAARSLAERTRATVVLKGASTIVYSGSRGVVNTTGTPWLSTAGSGDVLAGIICALALQGLSRFDAAAAGVALHGICGEVASHVSHPIIASDLISAIPVAWDKVFSQRS